MVGLGMPLKDIFLAHAVARGRPVRQRPQHERALLVEAASRRLPDRLHRDAVPGAVGMARAIKADGRDEIVYVSSGEGATSEGEFFEALNWASREQLPVLFVIQNNGYAISVPQETQTGIHIHEIAPRRSTSASIEVDGTRFTEMYTTLKPLVDRMRDGAGPALRRGARGAPRLALVLRRPARSTAPTRSSRMRRAARSAGAHRGGTA